MRYYYDDPLAAAWMAKHFGMRFCDISGLTVSADLKMWYMAERHYIAGSLYIHPDSLHLLEPKEGDMVSWYEIYSNIMIAKTLKPKEESDGFIAIIQRKGIPFHWPKKES